MHEDAFTCSLTSPASFTLGEPIVVTFSITNNSPGPVRVLVWGSPLEDEVSNYLEVRRDGEKLPYDGRYRKRGTPEPDAYRAIAASETVTVVRDISQSYPIDVPGEYTVALVGDLLDAFELPPTGEPDQPRTNFERHRLPAQALTTSFTVVAGGAPRRTTAYHARATESAAAAARSSHLDSDVPRIDGGTGDQQQIVWTAHQAAQDSVDLVLDLLIKRSPAENHPYDDLLGEITDARWRAVTGNVENIRTGLHSDLTYDLTGGPVCDPMTVAYSDVGTHTIHLCALFWTLSPAGFDTFYGTIVHEMSHLNAGTDDVTYGLANCRDLADGDPDQAITNADSYEYFVETIGGQIAARSELGVISRTSDRLDVFGSCHDATVNETSWQDGSNWDGIGNWRNRGGFFVPGSRISAVSRTSDRIDLFGVAYDGTVNTALWHHLEGWSHWRNIGGNFLLGAGGGVTAIARDPDNLQLFIVGDDGIVYTAWWQQGHDWVGLEGWTPIGGSFPVGGRISAVSRTPDRIDLVTLGGDNDDNNQVYTLSWHQGQDWGTSTHWEGIGGSFPISSFAAAVSRAPDHIDVFILGNDGQVYTSWWHDGDGWSGLNGWQPLGGAFEPAARISAVARTADNLDLFSVSGDGNVRTAWWQEGHAWSGIGNAWKAIGGTFPRVGTVAAVSRTPDLLDLFVTGADGMVYTSWWNTGSDWSGYNGWMPLGC